MDSAGCILYIFVHVCVCNNNNNKDARNLKENMGGIQGRVA